MIEQIQQNQLSASSAPTILQRLGQTSHTKPRVQEVDYYENRRIVLRYETYEKIIGPQLTLNQRMKVNQEYQKKLESNHQLKRNEFLAQSRQQSYDPLMDLIVKNKNIQFKKMWTNQLSFEEQKKSRTNTRQMKWVGSSEDINGDKFPEYVVRDHRGFIQSADGLRITVPIKRQRVIKYFSENRTKEERQEKNYKQLQEEENPADGNRLFIKNYLSSFLKERDYTIAQVCSVIGGRIWKGVIVQQLLLHYNKSYQGQSFDEDDATSLVIYNKLNKAIK